jgi:site-specific DNA recombinase
LVVREKELKNIFQDDLQNLFQSFQNESFLESILNKLNTKKRQIHNELQNVDKQIKDLRKRKIDCVNLFTDNLISKGDLNEYKELTDESLKELDLSKTQLQKKLEECTNENFTLEMGNKLKEFLSLKELSSQVLHSLVEKITSNNLSEFRIHYNFVNPFQEKEKGNGQ